MAAYLLGHLRLDVTLWHCYPKLLKNKGILADKLKSVVFYVAVYEIIAKIKANLFSVDLKSIPESASPLRVFCGSVTQNFLKTKQKITQYPSGEYLLLKLN